MTPSSENAIRGLTAHARWRTTDARRRIKRALKDMRDTNATININAVATKAKVSRKTIYNNPDLRAQIKAHSQTSSPPQPSNANESGVDAALKVQLITKEAQIKQLKATIAEQKSTIALLYGKIDDLTK